MGFKVISRDDYDSVLKGRGGYVEKICVCVYITYISS